VFTNTYQAGRGGGGGTAAINDDIRVQDATPLAAELDAVSSD